MEKIIQLQRKIVQTNRLFDWFENYSWLDGFIGNINSPIWFIGENPSLTGIKNIDNRFLEKSSNLQWNASAGDTLLRESLTEAGLKNGDSNLNEGWHCYITNAIKEPEIVSKWKDKKRDSQFLKEKAKQWLSVLQLQIDMGKPKVLVALSGQSEKILNYMIKIGLKMPNLEKILHYSSIMFRPEVAIRKGFQHLERIKAFKSSIKTIAKEYNIWDSFFLSDARTDEGFLTKRAEQ